MLIPFQSDVTQSYPFNAHRFLCEFFLKGLRRVSPVTTGTIPSSKLSRSANIPLRNLIPASRLSEDHSTALLESTTVNEKDGSRHSLDSADSDFSFFSDTGDLAEQLAAEEDPLHIQIRESFDEASGSHARGGRQHKRSVRYIQQDHLQRKNTNPGIDKEAIEIPEPQPRYISRAEKVVAVIMTGNREASQMHGLTGKALLYVFGNGMA